MSAALSALPDRRWLVLLLLGLGSAPLARAADCAALLRADFSALADAPTQLTLAQDVPQRNGVPAYCRVQGYVRSNVRFELRLPAGDWNGKLMMEGCGGFCGTLEYVERCNARLARGYACISTDMGHGSTLYDGKWAYNNREAEIDFGYRATHVTAVAGKAIAAAYYARAPQRAYFHGCSTGGRQGLVSAQRFPADFDGIIAGAPVLRMPSSGMVPLWAMRAMQDAQGRRIVTPRELQSLHRAVMQRCDARDGLVDGIIADPRDCDFDPAELACGRDGRQDCLTPPQVEALRKVYDGPRGSDGRRLFPSGLPLGSELNWVGPLVSPDETAPQFAGFIGDLFRYMAFAEDPGPAWKLSDFDFDRDPARLGAMAQIYTGANPDLAEFKARGGRLILYHGWSDQTVVPLPSIEYYELVTRAMGGPARTRDFFRLFLVPGMNHCGGGVGASEIDYLAALEQWSEQGKAPEMLLGARPASPAQLALRRPVYAYPARTVYDGHGDPADPHSFIPLGPALVVGGLRAITLTTADEAAARHTLVDGFGLRELPDAAPTTEQRLARSALWGLAALGGWRERWYERAGDAAAPRVRLLVLTDAMPRVREAPSATRDGGASMSFALQRSSGALARLAAAGFHPIGDFTVPLAGSGGGQYVVEEFYFIGPDNLLIPVVVRPPGMPSIARIDPASGLGGPAYAGITVANADAEIAFHRAVLGLELRRDIELSEPPLLRAAGLPPDAKVRFVQMFAPGTTTANLTLIDLGAKGERNPSPIEPPSRGAVMWTFAVTDLEEARRRVVPAGGEVVSGPMRLRSQPWGEYRAMTVRSPGHLRFELIETGAD